jgi:ubiquinone/menaquinone biosynthesis C-methylase UbiE
MVAPAEPGDAIERARRLLTPEAAAVAAAPEALAPGYLDLLGTDELESTGTAQDLMLTELVPRIYEHWWRPVLARAVKGVAGPSMAEELRIARLLMGLGPGDAVLDVACGPGNFTREFAAAVGDQGLVVGIDASLAMLARGVAETEETGIHNLALVRGDATRLPFRDGSFNAVSCFAALHLFAEPMAGLDEMRRVLADCGQIAIMTSLRRGPVPSAVTPIIERASGMRVFEGDEIVEALERRGFTGIQRRVAGLVQFVGGRLA